MQLLKTKELAKRLDVHPETVRRMVSRGDIPYVRSGNTLRFELDKVLAAMSSDNRPEKDRDAQ